MDLCRWSAGPTSWATSCMTVESNLSCFLSFRALSRASCASLSLSRWKVGPTVCWDHLETGLF